MSRNRPLVVAHRAGNELGTLRDAEALGVDLVEADVHLFRGRLEVRHLKTVGPLDVLWDRWYLAPRDTPRAVLADLLDAADPATELMLDLKGPFPPLARLVAAELRARPERARVTVAARNWWLLRSFRAMPGVRRVRSVGARWQLAVLLRLTRAPLDGVSIHERLVDPPTAAALRRRTDLIVAWAVKDLGRARELAELGVGGVIVEDPALMREVLAWRAAWPG